MTHRQILSSRFPAGLRGAIALLAATLGAGVLTGCAQPSPGEEARAPEGAAARLVLPDVPADVEERVGAFFESRVELVGYDMQRGHVAAPGSVVSVKLYWRSLAPVEAGYMPFAELLGPGGKVLKNAKGEPVKNQGVLGRTLPPEKWQPGKVYIDTVLLRVPRDITAPIVSLAVGLEKQRTVRPDEPVEAAKEQTEKAGVEATAVPLEETVVTRLTVAGGAGSGKQAAVIANLRTGLTADHLPTRLLIAFDRAVQHEREAAAKQRKGRKRRPIRGRRPGGH